MILAVFVIVALMSLVLIGLRAWVNFKAGGGRGSSVFEGANEEVDDDEEDQDMEKLENADETGCRWRM